MTTQADSAAALGMPPDGVESTAPAGDHETSLLPSRPSPTSHELRIRVYAWCAEYGYHTDPDLPGAAGGL
jgi:hypothetical protein